MPASRLYIFLKKVYPGVICPRDERYSNDVSLDISNGWSTISVIELILVLKTYIKDDSGLVYILDDDRQFDITIGKGLNNDLFFVNLGFSFRIY